MTRNPLGLRRESVFWIAASEEWAVVMIFGPPGR
jgi:hypothetical protein